VNEMPAITRTVLYASVLGIVLSLAGCHKYSPVLVVSRVTHFVVQGNGTSLNFPLFAETIDIETIERDMAIAEYYHEKLSGLYNFQSFDLINSTVDEYLLDNPDVLDKSRVIYEHADSLTMIQLSMADFAGSQANYLFRITDQKNHQTRNHEVTVQNNQSASVGLLFDEERNRGHLIVVNLFSFSITPGTTAQEFAEFLKHKNSLNELGVRDEYVRGDQRWMNELFGPTALQLPLQRDAQPIEEPEEFVDFDTPPAPIGGMAAFGKAMVYPEKARREGREGRVLIKAHIDTSGSVTQCSVSKGADDDFNLAALEAIKPVKFYPAKKNELAVSVWVTIPFDFKLNK
jgi:TonB family protein